jgi:hypothetical protein
MTASRPSNLPASIHQRLLNQAKQQGRPLEKAVKVNNPDNARLTFDHVVNDKLQEMIDTNFKFYKQVTDDPDFARTFLDWLFQRYVKKSGAQDLHSKKEETA